MVERSGCVDQPYKQKRWSGSVLPALVAQRIEHLTTDYPGLSAVLTSIFAGRRRALCLLLSAVRLRRPRRLGERSGRPAIAAPAVVPTLRNDIVPSAATASCDGVVTTRAKPGQHVVDRLVRSCAPVQRDEDGRQHGHRLVAAVGGPQRSPKPLVTPSIISGTGQGGQRLGVEDQDGQSAS